MSYKKRFDSSVPWITPAAVPDFPFMLVAGQALSSTRKFTLFFGPGVDAIVSPRYVVNLGFYYALAMD